jgi:hypothetical protein
VDLDDGVVDIDQHRARVLQGAEQPAVLGEVEQEPGGHGVGLADVAEGERAQERAQRRGGVAGGQDRAHPAVPEQGHVIDAVGAGDHARHQRGQLQAGVGALVRRHAHPLVGQLAQPSPPGQGHHRDQTGRRHEIGLVENRRGDRAGVRKLHLRDALLGWRYGP